MGEKKLLLLLLLTTILRGQRAQQIPSPSEYAVKLCGREFVRAVIFTCGGSRWKRVSLQQQQGAAQQQPPLPGADFVQSDKGLEDIKLQSDLDPKLEQLRSVSQPAGQQSLKDLFNLYEDYNEYVPTSDNFNEYIRQLEDASHKSAGETGLAMGSNNLPWVKYPRRKRAFSMGVAGICCKWGCTKTEISTLC
ncbi:relaxin-3-like [Elgaria multicarinata webbii]|uniref:relaxin-3-like n=1 Tax=Elgaria multicarinata webbii TaxID=159646 RepID=UPI002FCCEDB0